MRTVLIASGESRADGAWQRWIRDGDHIIAADGGAAQALARGWLPDLVVGDMDSLPAGCRAELEARGCAFVVHPRAKDETDLELALSEAVHRGADEIVILGALGGRLDHTLANILLLALPWLAGRSVRIAEGPDEALLLRGGEAAAIHGQPGDLVSLLPLGGDACGVSTTGLAWPLHDEVLRFGFSRGVSNEMDQPLARISLREGCLLVVHRSLDAQAA